jgi:hypothetical protein
MRRNEMKRGQHQSGKPTNHGKKKDPSGNASEHRFSEGDGSINPNKCELT